MSTPVSIAVVQLRPVESADQLVRKLLSVSYHQRRRLLHVLMAAPRYPRFLYKFRTLHRIEDPQPDGPIFTERSVKELRTLLVDSLFWLSSPEAFNDPFDTWATWTIEGTDAEIRARLVALGEQYSSELTTAQRESAVERIMSQPRDQLIAQLRQSFAKQRRDMGVCCFCAGDPRNVLMWSHYAGAHFGICLQFETARDPMTLMRALPVDYVDRLKRLNWVKDEDYRHQMGHAMTSKHLHWVDESEHRILHEGGASNYVRYVPSALTGIIFGCRADQPLKDKVGQLLRDRAARGLPDVTLYYATMNEATYGIDICGAATGRRARWGGRLPVS